jgi:hypothetical protein
LLSVGGCLFSGQADIPLCRLSELKRADQVNSFDGVACSNRAMDGMQVFRRYSDIQC